VLELSDGRRLALDKATSADITDAGVRVSHVEGALDYASAPQQEEGERLFHEVSTPVGGEFNLTLSDGTLVYLNAGSRLRFPVRFAGEGAREVTLEGEAYFEVERAGSPFVVHAREMEVTVLGTGFNVMAYEEDARAELTLVHGKVNVVVGEEEWLLLPSRQLVVDRRTGTCTVREVERAGARASWRSGVLDFDSMSLEELATRLGRWYNVTFSFADERLKELQFTGAVRKYENIDYILDLIGATTDVAFEVEGNAITVREK
jgi:ferric-dicitrate binding protein FerR (iron transport regulator)